MIVMLTNLEAYITSVGVEVPNAVFEIKHWEHTTAISLADDGLSENRCWPSTLAPNDPGFALLTDDPWYLNHPAAAISTYLYSDPPANAVTKGKSKYRTIAGRPIIAVRSIDLPDVLGNATSAALGEDGPDQMVHTLDVDEASFTDALRNASTVTRLLSPTPRRVTAQPSLLSVVDYIPATPGSPIIQGIQPTGV
jgi:hypothetical protein